MWGRILYGYLLCHLAAAAPRPQFLVVIPNIITKGTDTNACIHLNNLFEPIILQFTLRINLTYVSLLRETIPNPNWYKCINLKDKFSQVSSPTEGRLEIAGLSNTFSFYKSKRIFLLHQENGTFIQTDKPIYKPGQTAKFRIVTLNENFVPDTSEISSVHIEDSQHNKIAQWLNVKTQQGIGDLSLPLASEALEGTYKITVQKGQSLVTHTFSVEKYVLPTFNAQLKLPRVISIMDTEFEVAVCSSYTYGKPFRGAVHIKLCRESNYFWYSPNSFELTKEFCKEFNGSTDAKGCFSKVIDTHYFHLRTPVFRMAIIATATITDHATGQGVSTTESTLVSYVLSKMKFEDVKSYYKSGMPFSGKIKVEDVRSSPMANKNVTLCYTWSNCETFTTDNKGYVHFSYNTSTWGTEPIHLTASMQRDFTYNYDIINPHSDGIVHRILPQYSKSSSYLAIDSVNNSINNCDIVLEIWVNYIFSKNAMEGNKTGLDFFYLITTNMKIAVHGQKSTEAGAGQNLEGTVSIKIPIEVDVAQNADVLVYTILPSGDVIADSRKLQIAKCFKNQVKLQFTESEVLPGSHTELHVKAAPDSLCALHAVDESVLILKPEEEITADKVYAAAKRDPTANGQFPASAFEVEQPPCIHHPLSGSYLLPGNLQIPYPMLPNTNYDSYDSYLVFLNVGLNLLTDISMRKPVSCSSSFSNIPFRNTQVAAGGVAAAPGAGVGVGFSDVSAGAVGLGVLPGAMLNILPEQPITPLTTIRKHFPETWIWELVPVGLTGEVEVPLMVPDTITKWKAGMFCMASLGFGLAENVALNVFQTFFVEPALPYSVIRGEAFTLKATVFNHMTQCIMVQVTLEESKDFLAKSCEKCQYTSCICDGEGKTFLWDIVPKSLGEVNFTITAEAIQSKETCRNEIVTVPQRGRRDTVIKPLLVQPEGTLVELAKSSLLCCNGTTLLEDIKLLIPKDVVEGSVRAHISVTGDILGRALQNIDKLLAMPFGCGEQNMARFAPNIYILEYLQKTGQLTPNIKEKAIQFLKKGYQGQLQYKHADGSYSTFGDRDEDGNTWLTAFVAKSFGQAKTYIFVDDTHLQQAFKWLESHQLPNGCFRNVGKLFQSSMKGGVNDDISLSAYITAAILELQVPLTSFTVTRSLLCLESALSNVTNPYTLALLAYTYTLARQEKTREEILKRLDSLAKKEDGMIHWERAEKPSEQHYSFMWYRAPSAEVEMAAYVLLALVSSPNPSKTDLGYAVKIVKWITKQQGYYGGFSSTQDTVVALHALSKYAVLVYGERSNITVNVKSGQRLMRKFDVNKNNSLLLQSMTITDVSRNYTAAVLGKGCILLQTTLKYNIPPRKNESTFAIQVKTVPTKDAEFSWTSFKIIINASYTGKRNVSNMAIIDVKMLSGYIPDKISLQELKSYKLVKKTEVKSTQVILYLEELGHSTTTLAFNVEQDFPVTNKKPAVVKIYDYYETDEYAITEYNIPSSLADAEEENNAR